MFVSRCRSTQTAKYYVGLWGGVLLSACPSVAFSKKDSALRQFLLHYWVSNTLKHENRQRTLWNDLIYGFFHPPVLKIRTQISGRVPVCEAFHSYWSVSETFCSYWSVSKSYVLSISLRGFLFYWSVSELFSSYWSVSELFCSYWSVSETFRSYWSVSETLILMLIKRSNLMQQCADIYLLQSHSTYFGCHSTHHQEH